MAALKKARVVKSGVEPPHSKEARPRVKAGCESEDSPLQRRPRLKPGPTQAHVGRAARGDLAELAFAGVRR